MHLLNFSALAVAVISLIACGGSGAGPSETFSSPPSIAAPSPAPSSPDPKMDRPLEVAFYTPTGIGESQLISSKSILYLGFVTSLNGTYQFPNLDSLKNLTEKEHSVILDLSDVLKTPRPKDQVNLTYEYQGKVYTKEFEPQDRRKVYDIVSDAEIRRRLDALKSSVTQYKSNISGLLVVDEPYLNGIRKSDLERAALTIKAWMADNDLNIPLSLNFASALFNKEFAKNAEKNLLNYVYFNDLFFREGKARYSSMEPFEQVNFDKWVKDFEAGRLLSYDQLSNLYTDGSLPNHYEEFSFDFYITTALLDFMYENSLQFLSGIENECQIVNRPVSQIRKELSFFQDGPVQTRYDQDKKILNDVFNCRMKGAAKLLRQELNKLPSKPIVSLVFEASPNGLLERDSESRAEQNQPDSLVEQRVLDEIQRYSLFFKSNPDLFTGKADVFLYSDAFDFSINQKIIGVQSMETVKTFFKEEYSKYRLLDGFSSK